ncbi:hypothetical protein SELMODRAFT_420539 [Selaginella moellendorffii]|uniref:Zinc-finger domain-containing protein n=1 Tax=Selaginella moellendorffii TaxID=88036 RepID=D8SCB6_SELML|nr:uncharacterized protein LOC9658325 [Selaginella moellendorffii]EFJ17676.1 hypothetical protein SELMODRAFT_420539 [Selaginella moellendorffii]|eukprot:XP_002980975.1 uncharacterized protein LOC9658325 [Selaginella moellendorffii]
MAVSDNSSSDEDDEPFVSIGRATSSGSDSSSSGGSVVCSGRTNSKIKRSSDAGRRIQHGRLYDSTNGITCHWCRQKTVEDKVCCSRCPISFCGSCLANRHGEILDEQMEEGVRWVCPKCRGGCGPGCVDSCCNCGPCRKAQGLAPTGVLKHGAAKSGFNNAHDYLIHLETGESVREIAQRKLGRDWIKPGSTVRYDTEPIFRRRIIRTLDDEDCTPKKRRTCEAEERTPPSSMRGALRGAQLRRYLSQLASDKAADKAIAEEEDEEASGKDVASLGSRVKLRLFQSRVKGEKMDHVGTSSIAAAAPAIKTEKPADEEQGKVFSRQKQVKMEKDSEASAPASQSHQQAGERFREIFSEAKQTKEREEKDEVNVGARVKAEKEDSPRTGSEQRATVAIVKNEEGGDKKTIRAGISSEEGRVSRGETPSDTQDERGIEHDSGSRENTPAPWSRARNLERAREHAQVFHRACRRNTRNRSNYSHLVDSAASESEEEEELEPDSDESSRRTQSSSLTEQQDSDSDNGTKDEGFVLGRDAGLLYRQQLEKELEKPFDSQQLESMLKQASCRKPVLRHRDTRRGSMPIATTVTAPSYLDYHPDLAEKVEAAEDEEKLRLLRGFFFWLMKTCDPGAFKPWVTLSDQEKGSDECYFDDPDCEITAVVVPLDEQREAKNLLRQRKTSIAPALSDENEETPTGHAKVKEEKLSDEGGAKEKIAGGIGVKVKEEKLTE